MQKVEQLITNKRITSLLFFSTEPLSFCIYVYNIARCIFTADVSVEIKYPNQLYNIVIVYFVIIKNKRKSGKLNYF